MDSFSPSCFKSVRICHEKGANRPVCSPDEKPSVRAASGSCCRRFSSRNLLTTLSVSRQTTLAVYLMSLVGMIVYTATLDQGHLWVVFITAGSLGYKATVRSLVCNVAVCTHGHFIYTLRTEVF